MKRLVLAYKSLYLLFTLISLLLFILHCTGNVRYGNDTGNALMGFAFVIMWFIVSIFYASTLYKISEHVKLVLIIVSSVIMIVSGCFYFLDDQFSVRFNNQQTQSGTHTSHHQD